LEEQSFDSDLIVWRANFSRNNMELKQAYSDLNNDVKRVKVYLKSKGIAKDEIVFEAAEIQKKFHTEYDSDGNEIVFYGIQFDAKHESTHEKSRICGENVP
jgi:hypothetical protein